MAIFYSFEDKDSLKLSPNMIKLMLKFEMQQEAYLKILDNNPNNSSINYATKFEAFIWSSNASFTSSFTQWDNTRRKVPKRVGSKIFHKLAIFVYFYLPWSSYADRRPWAISPFPRFCLSAAIIQFPWSNPSIVSFVPIPPLSRVYNRR